VKPRQINELYQAAFAELPILGIERIRTETQLKLSSLERFRWTYNFERPHQALGYCVPADLFCRKSGLRSIH
jgi:transposase InsO family protein